NPAYLQIVYGGILLVAVVLGGVVSRESTGGLRRTGVPLFARRRPSQQLVLPESLLPTQDNLDAAPAGQRAGGASYLRTTWRMLSAAQARFPIAQVVALVIVFIYG